MRAARALRAVRVVRGVRGVRVVQAECAVRALLCVCAVRAVRPLMRVPARVKVSAKVRLEVVYKRDLVVLGLTHRAWKLARAVGEPPQPLFWRVRARLGAPRPCAVGSGRRARAVKARSGALLPGRGRVAGLHAGVLSKHWARRAVVAHLGPQVRCFQRRVRGDQFSAEFVRLQL